MSINLPLNTLPRVASTTGAVGTTCKEAVAMTKRTPKNKKNQPIADAGDFVSVTLGRLEPGQAVQLSFDIQFPGEASRTLCEAANRHWLVDASIKQAVYFAQEQSPAGFIKIGYTKHLGVRLGAINTSNPHGVRLLGYIKGTTLLEKELHQQFAAYRFRAEWFYPDPELLGFIAGLTKMRER